MSTHSQQAKSSPDMLNSRIAANRANAQRSTGPRTKEGKAVSSRNAVVTGLTGRTVILPSDDIDEYVLHLSSHHAEYLPITDAESELVQAIADCEWRLRRILTLEHGIYALGERQLEEHFPEEPEAIRRILIKTETHLLYQKQLSNLSIQESRLQRQKAKAITALDLLKKNRPQTPAGVAAQPLAASAAAGSYPNIAQSMAASALSRGFEFSAADRSTNGSIDPTLQLSSHPSEPLLCAVPATVAASPDSV